MQNTHVPSEPLKGTAPPISGDVLDNNPFLGWTASRLIKWAQEHLEGGGLSAHRFVILDKHTAEDDTCLLVAEGDDSSISDNWCLVRSDFETSLVTLETIEMAVGGNEHLDTDYVGFDGVLRMSVKDAAEA